MTVEDLRHSTPAPLPETGRGLLGDFPTDQKPKNHGVPRVARCPKCGQTWTGHNVEHCTVCHESFSGSTSGDRHRIGDFSIKEGPRRRRCRTPDEMRALGMQQNDRGIWTNGGESPWAKS